MKVTIESEDLMEAKRLIKSLDLALVIWDLHQKFFNQDEVSSEEFNQVLSNNNIDIYDLVE